MENRLEIDSEIHIRELQDLLEAVRQLSDIMCSDEQYATLAEIVGGKLGADAIAVFIWHEDIGRFKLVFNQGFRFWQDEFKCEESLLSKITQNGFKTLLMRNLLEYMPV